MLEGGTISWIWFKKTIIASSTIKFTVYHEAPFQVIWLRDFVMGLKVIDPL